jgi:hypothetical protein
MMRTAVPPMMRCRWENGQADGAGDTQGRQGLRTGRRLSGASGLERPVRESRNRCHEAIEALLTGKLIGLPGVLHVTSHLTMKTIKTAG